MIRATQRFLRLVFLVTLLHAMAAGLSWLTGMSMDRSLIFVLMGFVMSDHLDRKEFEQQATRCFRTITDILASAKK